jgi:hypothetical protein
MDDLRYPLVARENEPDYDTTEVSTLAGHVRHFRRCRHANVVPVESLGDVVAHLCIDCDEQLPAWRV